MTQILIDKYNFCRLKAYNKKFSFPFETIPKDLVRHFIRGSLMETVMLILQKQLLPMGRND